jgi:hypothetical protein
MYLTADFMEFNLPDQKIVYRSVRSALWYCGTILQIMGTI